MAASCMVCCVQGDAVRKTSASNTMRLDAAKREHQATRGEMEAQARRAAKLDKKANILITGLQQRDTKLRSQLDELAQQVGVHLPRVQSCGTVFCKIGPD